MNNPSLEVVSLCLSFTLQAPNVRFINIFSDYTAKAEALPVRPRAFLITNNNTSRDVSHV